MDRKLAILLVMPVMGIFSVPALAAWHGNQAGDQHHHINPRQQHYSGHAVHFVKLPAHDHEDRDQSTHRKPSHDFIVGNNAGDKGAGKRDKGGWFLIGGDHDGNNDHDRGGDGNHHGDRGGDHDRGGDRDRDRYGDNDRYRHHDRGNDGDRYRYDRWHRERYERDGRIYWRFNIHLFPRYDLGVWRGGYWHHGWYGGRWGWWWVVGGIWYYYPAPIYPYPNPYVPGSVVIINNQMDTPTPPADAPAQFWYYCRSPQGYYPYVPECPGGWAQVAATPSNATMPASPPTQSPTPAPTQPSAPVQPPAPVQYWYHCKSPEGYYPYVKTCPGGWDRVPATPPSTSSSKPRGGG